MQLEECINFILTHAQNVVYSYFKSSVSKYDVTPAQYAVLKCLWDHGDQRAVELSRALYLDPSTITGVLDRMERKELLERIHGVADRREIIIRILPAGKILQSDIEAIIQETNLEVLAGLTDIKLLQCKETLGHIVNNIERMTGEESSSNNHLDIGLA